MNESNNHNDFKLLAIRPLQGCNPNLLKGLKPNCIYRFYNEYKYLDKNGNEVITKNERCKIESIKHTPAVPSDLYGKNISISAIVGQNGSGKSSLLEIFYYFLFNYSRNEGLLENDDKLGKIDSKEFHFEFYYLLDDEIHCIGWDYINFFMKTRYQYNAENQTFERDSDTESFNKGNDYKIPIYSIVTNYSIYGLNSNSDEDRWLDKLFIKNDGYQTPIVLNPYREDGNINVNREFELANSRLLKVFLSTSTDSNEFNTTHLINDVSVNKLIFKLNLDKNLKVYFDGENEELENVIDNFEVINDYEIKDFYNSLYKEFSIEKEFKTLQFSYSKIDFLNKKTLVENCLNLSNLYIFKKIVKIVCGYKSYKTFKTIFKKNEIGNLDSNSNLKNHFLNQYQKYFLSDPKRSNQIDILEKSKQQFEYDIDRLKSIEKSLLKNYYSIYEKSYVDKLYDQYQNKSTEQISIYDAINKFIDDFNKLLSSNENRREYINLLLTKLTLDKSHVTLKLRQVLNMQNSKFFNNLIANNEKNPSVVDSKNTVYYTVEDSYLRKSKNLKIDEIPNAFLEPIFMFNKKDLKQPFELKYLSSGEQQLLHSTISLSYHIDNLLSIIENEKQREKEQDSDKSVLRTYKKINIILDEIELYYHPEYQREYLNNLIILLSQEKYKVLSFNVIFSTHSPFILSDIPSQNILKLKEGKPAKDEDDINSFGANIYDLLKDEFFLKNGAIGAFTSNKINEILRKDIVEQEDIDIINLIGDSFLKGVIKKKIEDKISIDALSKEIERLQKIQQKRSQDATN